MKRRDEVLVGVVATLALAVAIAGSLMLARGGLAPGYQLYTVTQWGSGLRAGNPVLLSGVRVGYVEDVDFRRDGSLVVFMRVQTKYKVPRNASARILPNGIFGDMMVAVDPGEMTELDFAAGDTVPSGPPSTQVAEVLDLVDSIGRGVQTMLTALNRELVEARGLAQMRETVASANELIATISRVAETQSAELTKTQEALRRTAGGLDSAVVDSTVRALAGLTTDLRSTTASLNGVLAKLERGEGSAGQLLNDDGLYRDTRALLQRLDSLTTDFQKNPRKYIKLSVF